MKKFLFISSLLTCLFAAQTKAQDSAKHYIGIKGGLSIPNLTAGGSVQNEINSGYSSRLGPDFAIFYEYHISKKFSLSTQLEYSAEGGKKNGFQAFPNPADSTGTAPYLYANYKSEAKINYLLLSELAKINLPIGSKWSFYAEVGPFVGLLVSAHQVTSGTSDVYADKEMQIDITKLYGLQPQSFDNKENIKDDLHKGNFGVEGDVGFSLSVNKSKIFIEGGGNYGFLNIQKGTENGKNHIGAGTVRVGYACGL